jgi:hypothetical protein
MDGQEDSQEETERIEEAERFNDELKSSKAFLAAISTTLTEVIDAAVRDISVDPEYPDTPPETWQMLFVILGSDRVRKAMTQELRSRVFATEP